VESPHARAVSCSGQLAFLCSDLRPAYMRLIGRARLIATTQVRRTIRKTLKESDVFLLKETVFRNSNPSAARYISYIAGVDIPDDVRSKKILFIHVPRTGGTSIAIALYGQKTDHHSAAYYRAIDQAFFSQCFKFTFVRNPWDRLVSAYHLLRRGHTEYVRVWSPQKYSDLLDMSFDDFVCSWLWKRREQLMELDTTLWTQAYFTHSPDGDSLVDFVGRRETMEADLLHLRERRNIAIRNMHLNRSLNREDQDYRSYYTDQDTVEAVREIYAKDIAFFKYDF